MKRFGVMLLAAALLTGVASADIQVYSGSTYDAFITDPVPVGDGSEGLIGFTLYLNNKSGDAANNMDVYDDQSTPTQILGEGPFSGLTGEFHQHDAPGFGSFTPTLDVANYATAIDSHFLVLTPNLLVISAPGETRNVAPSLEASDAPVPYNAFGETTFGDYMGGAFANNLWGGGTQTDLAYLVIRDPGMPLTGNVFGAVDNVVDSFFLATGTGSGAEEVRFGIVPIPEPATMGLLAIGGVAALIRRRR